MVIHVNNFDSGKCPLDGVYLIDASAGTGKTYNIQDLVVRLIVEKGLTIDQILVVTFTRMATAELLDRIRKILQSCSDYLEYHIRKIKIPEGTDFKREHQLLKNVLPDFADVEKIKSVREKLQGALLNFDSNAISTIHGFCKKILEKNAFESGILFQTDLDGGEVAEEQILGLIRNQWRKICYAPENRKYIGIYRGLLSFDQCFNQEENQPADDYLLHTEKWDFFRSSTGTESFVSPGLDGFIGLVKHPEIEFDFEVKESYSVIAEQIFTLAESLGECGCDWQIPVRDPKQKPLSAMEFQNCNLKYGFGWKAFERLLGEADFESWIPENENQHLFRERILRLRKEILRFRVALLSEIRRKTSDRLEDLKARDNFQTFDDLQKRTLAALEAPGSILAESARTQFKAAIVDEFQDTDPVQYEIFTRIFAPGLTSGDRNRGCLFFVGDPKQAIYAFRGGDIFTYKEAAEAVGSEHTLSLGKNFRSAGKLVEAVNSIFQSHSLPFADCSIPFVGVDNKGWPALLFPDGEDEQPFHYLNGGKNKTEAYRNCAGKICQLLNSGVQYWNSKDKKYVPVTPANIAVLCRSCNGIDPLLEFLREKGIPYVVNNEESLYDTQEARDLEKLLLAVQDPSNVVTVTWLMQTGLTDSGNCRALCGESDTESRNVVSGVQEHLANLGKLYELKGFPVMFQQFMKLFGIHKRYPGMVSGAQKYSNLLQLRDVLTIQEKLGSKNPASLLLWLQKQLSPETRTDQESKVILSTDAPAVRIMTIHASKGLEFPIVFLPDLATSEIKKERAEKYHNPMKENKVYHRITYSPLSDLAVAEALQDSLRVVYVAFTRASNASYLLIPEKEKKQFSAIAWLFTAKTISSETPPEQLKNAFESLTKPTLAESIGLEMIEQVEPSEETFSVSASGTLEQQNWENSKVPAPVPKISYSSAHKFFRSSKTRFRSEEETSGNLGAEQIAKTTMDLPEVFTLPHGDLFGTACHTILEKLDFQNPGNLDFLVQRYLSVVNIGEQAGIASRMFRNVINSPIPFGDGSDFTLAEISLSNRVSEMDFDFKLNKKFDPARIGSVLNHYYGSRLEQEALEGLFALHDLPGKETFYTGSADLVFRHKGKYFIVDWKTDILEKKMEHFQPEHLFGEMWNKFYLYQSLLYSSALLRFLALRLGKSPEEAYREDYGGVRYLFLRGMDPAAPGRGVYADRPDFELICKIAEVENAEC